MKALRAEYLEQQETASDLAGLIAEKEKQLPVLADVTGRKANAYVFCHEASRMSALTRLLMTSLSFMAPSWAACSGCCSTASLNGMAQRMHRALSKARTMPTHCTADMS